MNASADSHSRDLSQDSGSREMTAARIPYTRRRGVHADPVIFGSTATRRVLQSGAELLRLATGIKLTQVEVIVRIAHAALKLVVAPRTAWLGSDHPHPPPLASSGLKADFLKSSGPICCMWSLDSRISFSRLC